MFQAEGIAFVKALREGKAWPIQTSEVERTREWVAKDVTREVSG